MHAAVVASLAAVTSTGEGRGFIYILTAVTGLQIVDAIMKRNRAAGSAALVIYVTCLGFVLSDNMIRIAGYVYKWPAGSIAFFVIAWAVVWTGSHVLELDSLEAPRELVRQIAARLKWSPGVLRDVVITALVLIAGLIASWWLAPPAYDAAIADLRRDVASYKADVGRITNEAIARLAAEAGQTGAGNSNAATADARAALDDLGRAAAQRLDGVQATPERRSFAKRQIEDILNGARASLSQSVQDATVRSATETARKILESARVEIESAGTAGAADARSHSLPDAEQTLVGTDEDKLDDVRKQLVASIMRDIDGAAAKAIDAAARSILSHRVADISVAGRQPGIQQGKAVVDAAGRKIDAAFDELARFLLQDAAAIEIADMHVAAKGIVAASEQDKARSREQRNSQLEPLHKLVEAQGFNLCVDTEMDGTNLYVDDRGVTSADQCAVKCHGTAGCDAFRAQQDRNGVHCMLFKNGRVTGTSVGIMSGRRGSC